MSNERHDNELDEMLKPFQSLQPSLEQLSRWQKSGAPPPKLTRVQWISRSLQLTAAAGVGFLIGAAVFKSKPEISTVTENFDSTATIEMVYVKGD